MARDQKKAEQEERTIVWIDQTGFYLLPFVVHTYAPKGKTPILRAPLSKDHLSVISAITPAGRVLLHTQERAYRSPDIVRFLKHLLHHIPGKLLVIWDGSPIHRGEPVKQFLANGGAERIHLEPCLLTHRISTPTKQDQSTAGTLRSQSQRLGSIMIMHPSHPLAGQTLPVVRRYREHGERLWVIELPDGSRQYVPASWCTSLASSESPSLTGDSSVGRQSPEGSVSPLSLAALRDLAALVRHLREREEVRRKEHADDAVVERRELGDEHRASVPSAGGQSPAAARPAVVGEFPACGSPLAGWRDRPDRTPAGAEPSDGSPLGGEGVSGQ